MMKIIIEEWLLFNQNNKQSKDKHSFLSQYWNRKKSLKLKLWETTKRSSEELEFSATLCKNILN